MNREERQGREENLAWREMQKKTQNKHTSAKT
jgi:hypothetical protein